MLWLQNPSPHMSCFREPVFFVNPSKDFLRLPISPNTNPTEGSIGIAYKPTPPRTNSQTNQTVIVVARYSRLLRIVFALFPFIISDMQSEKVHIRLFLEGRIPIHQDICRACVCFEIHC